MNVDLGLGQAERMIRMQKLMMASRTRTPAADPGHGGGLDPATDPAATLSSIRTGDTDTDPERDLATNTSRSSGSWPHFHH